MGHRYLQDHMPVRLSRTEVGHVVRALYLEAGVTDVAAETGDSELRLLLATGDARYADHMERVLYNGFAAAVSADGHRFFYVNPLQRREDHFEQDDPGRRHEWFSCACCPPNIMRLIASLGHYVATTADGTLYLHQFTGSRLSGAGLEVEVVTGYPWSGRVDVTVLERPARRAGAGRPRSRVERRRPVPSG